MTPPEKPSEARQASEDEAMALWQELNHGLGWNPEPCRDAIRAALSAARRRALEEAKEIVHAEIVSAMGAAPTYAEIGYRIEYRLGALASREEAAGAAAPRGKDEK